MSTLNPKPSKPPPHAIEIKHTDEIVDAIEGGR
jgi:hypothetical protein